jgi:hypothetical protein
VCLGNDEGGHDLAGRPAKRQRRAISEAVRVKVSNELAERKARIPSSRAFGKVEEHVSGGLPAQLSALPE